MTGDAEVILAAWAGYESDTNGPGMGITIPGFQIRALLGLVRELQAELVEARKAAPVRGAGRRPSKNQAAVFEARARVWRDVVAALADILEGHPELHGLGVVDALNAWMDQHEIPEADVWRGELAGALSGAVSVEP